MRRRPEVVVFTPSLRPGGAERVTLNLIRVLARRGVALEVVAATGGGEFQSELPASVPLTSLGAARVLGAIPGFTRYLETTRPKAVLAVQDHANLVAIWSRQLAHVSTRVVATVHISASYYGAMSFKDRFLPFFMRRTYPAADGIVCVSEGVADALSSLIRLPRPRLQVIYNPVLSPRLLERSSAPCGHPWFAPGEPPVVLGVGRLTRVKEFSLLIQAFERVRAERLCRLVILGEGPERVSLDAQVARSPFAADIQLPGFVPNPYAYMARAGVFVLSSSQEGLPTVLIEAGALGVPLVSTDCPTGPREILEGGRFGCLVPVHDVPALAAGIDAALADRIPRAPASAWLPYDEERAADAYLELLLPGRAP